MKLFRFALLTAVFAGLPALAVDEYEKPSVELADAVAWLGAYHPDTIKHLRLNSSLGLCEVSRGPLAKEGTELARHRYVISSCRVPRRASGGHEVATSVVLQDIVTQGRAGAIHTYTLKETVDHPVE